MTVNLEETFREALPMHFLFRIESFSLLSKNSIRKYESNEFDKGGYKWKLSLYPDGNKDENGDGHISLYLMLVSDSSTDSPPPCWELNVFFKLFLFDQIRDRYLFRGDMEGKTRRFHEMKKMWGFPQFLSLSKLNDPANGYLVGDTCIFGAEVFIAKPPRNIECLSMVKEVTTVKYTWKIEDFSNIKEEYLQSKMFEAGDHNWNLIIYPKGDSEGKDNSLSFYLNIVDCEEDPSLRIYADYILRIKDQINDKHLQSYPDSDWFCASRVWGWPTFIHLNDLYNKGKGYLVNDTCIVEAEVKVLGVGVVCKRPKIKFD